MTNTVCLLLFVFGFQLSCIHGIKVAPIATDLNCRLTCSNDNKANVDNSQQNTPNYQGLPGKMGPIGPPGPVGPPGPKGDSCVCPDFSEFRNEFNKWKDEIKVAMSRDCSGELARNHVTGLGRFTIYPFFNDMGLEVLCDQSTDGGGWTVIQRRVDNSVNFYRNWTEYQRGFGNLDTNFWLGLDNIHAILKSGPHEVRFDMEDFDNNIRYAQYSHFNVGPSTGNYVMTISGYSGDAGNSGARNNGNQFTTFDVDHDGEPSDNCAQLYKGGWWYDNCHEYNPNGLYLGGPHDSYANGINWRGWRGYNYSLKRFEIKIRKTY